MGRLRATREDEAEKVAHAPTKSAATSPHGCVSASSDGELMTSVVLDVQTSPAVRDRSGSRFRV